MLQGEMRRAKLTDLDLRLLRVLDALLESNSVAMAAVQLGITSSAVSHSLRALRDRLGDQLFVRVKNRLEPTARALAMRSSLRHALTSMEGMINARPGFDPRTSTRRFSVATVDAVMATRFPDIIARIARDGPSIDIRVELLETGLRDRLFSGELDLVVGGAGIERPLGLDRGLMRSRVFQEPYRCIVRAGHPALTGDELSLETYVRLPHVLVTTILRGERGVVDDALAKRGLERRVARMIPSFSGAVTFVANSDMVSTLPHSLALHGSTREAIKVYVPPIPLPDAVGYMWWHPRERDEPGHIWWRRQIASIAD